VPDLGRDSAVVGRGGRYSARLVEDWEIWGPQGGYVAAVALRAAAAASSFPRPVSLACHYLRGAQLGPVDIAVESLRRTRCAESLRVTLVQNDERILVALAWTAAELVGIDHDGVTRLDVPSAEQLDSWEMYWPGGDAPFRSGGTLTCGRSRRTRRIGGRAPEPRWLAWSRLRQRPPLEDPYVDAARMLLSADAAMYPAATLAHGELFPYVAPSMDLMISFHLGGANSEWLLIDAFSPLSSGAVVSGAATIWSEDGRVLASAMQQMLQRS
jgi:acyl-CoA thioesterase